MVGVSYDNLIFKTVKNAVIHQANHKGFTKAESGVIDELTNILCSYMMSVSVGSKQYCELAGRSTVNSFDLMASLTDYGITIKDMIGFMKTHASTEPVPLPSIIPMPMDPVIKIGEEKPMPQHIPSFLPKFPNPHTYVCTEITSDIEFSYAKARELQAQNIRNAENSLYRYALSTHDNYCLFRQLHETVKEKAKSELEKQEAELQAKRARYSDNVSEMFELRETTNSIVRKTIPDYYFVLMPFPIANPTTLALCDDLEEEAEQAHHGDVRIDASKLSEGMEFSMDEAMLTDSALSDEG